MPAVITTLIPTYRRPALLRRSIMSALNQTFRELEVHVFDNASGDETAAVVAEIQASDSRVQYFCHPENIGLLGNMASVLKNVRTPYFSLLCDDDVMLPDFYAMAIEAFEQHPDAIFTAAMAAHISTDGDLYGVPLMLWSREYYPPGEAALEMLRHGHPDNVAILFHRDAIDLLGGFNTSIGTSFDVDFELRAAASRPVCFIRKIGGLFVISPHQASQQVDDYVVRKKAFDSFLKSIPIDDPLQTAAPQAWSHQISVHAWNLALHLLADGNFVAAEEQARILRECNNYFLQANVISMLSRIGSPCIPLLRFHRNIRRLQERIQLRTRIRCFLRRHASKHKSATTELVKFLKLPATINPGS